MIGAKTEIGSWCLGGRMGQIKDMCVVCVRAARDNMPANNKFSRRAAGVGLTRVREGPRVKDKWLKGGKSLAVYRELPYCRVQPKKAVLCGHFFYFFVRCFACKRSFCQNGMICVNFTKFKLVLYTLWLQTTVFLFLKTEKSPQRLQ